MRLLVVVAAALIASGCIESHLTTCGDVACPSNKVCDGRGGCALPEQLAGCMVVADGERCSYPEAGDLIRGYCQAALCVPEGCGNGEHTPDEVCDDANNAHNDGCSADCRSDETCGNGVVDAPRGEQCDDANAVDADACHANCLLPRCGDGIVDALLGETCDAGADNANVPNTCRITCRVPACGDGITDTGEVCDDGNLAVGDGCAPGCMSNETCGNGILDALIGEQCDDSNDRPRDGCSACRQEDVAVLVPGQRPAARFGHGMAYDAARQRVVLFGGVPLIGDTWEWDGTSWTRMRPRHSPAARSGHALAYDAARRRVVLFGGATPTGFAGDTWEWDGVDWTQRTTLVAPPGRKEHAMAFHAGSGMIVLTGGNVGGADYTDTWLWNGTTWTQVAGTTATARSNHVLVYDPSRDVLIAAGPASTSPTATWNGAAWQVHAATGIDCVRCPSAWDPTRQRVVLAQATSISSLQLWSWNSVTPAWEQETTQNAPMNRYHTVLAYDAARGEHIMFGGLHGNFGTGDETWLFDGTKWRMAAAWTEPAPTWRMAHAYDPLRGRTVAVGDDAREWNGRQWSAIATPSAMQRPQLVFHRAERKVALITADPFSTGIRVSYFDGTGWMTPANGSDATIDRRGGNFVSRDSTGDIVRDGGRDERNIHVYTTADGWMLNGGDESIFLHASAIAYDPLRDRMVRFGGGAGMGSLDSLPRVNTVWEYASEWLPVAVPGVMPDPRAGHKLVYNPDALRVVLYGSNETSTSEDLWEWSGTTWYQRTLANGVTSSYRPAIAYHAATRSFVTFGGRDADFNALGVTRVLAYRSHTPLESCTSAVIDYDNDGDAGCADDECWAVCAPLCTPGLTCDPALPRCGDGACGAVESCELCPVDCGVCTGACGNHRCDSGESAQSCPGDCK